MTRSIRAALVLLITIVAFVIYAYRLDRPAITLHPEENNLEQQAQSLARTGRDVDGEFLPLYLHVRDNLWAQPLPVYVTALFLLASGVSETTMRLPSLLLAAANIALIFGVARRLWGRDLMAVIAAGLFIITPAHVIHGRLAFAPLYPVPFILAWLLCLIVFVQQRNPTMLFASTLALGVGFYTDPTAVLTMPAYVALTLLTVRWLRESRALYAFALAGFALPLLILVPYFVRHHATFRFTLGDWGLHTLANPRDGLRYSMFNWEKLATRSSIYWGFFSPSYLFFPFRRDPAPAAQVSVFLGLTAVPLLYGAYRIVVLRWSDPVWRVMLLGFLMAPLAAASFDEAHAMGRGLSVLPFGIVMACVGFDAWLTSRTQTLRALGIGVLCLMPIQFYRFYSDYLSQDTLRPPAVATMRIDRPR